MTDTVYTDKARYLASISPMAYAKFLLKWLDEHCLFAKRIRDVLPYDVLENLYQSQIDEALCAEARRTGLLRDQYPDSDKDYNPEWEEAWKEH